ncbi:MAG: hypothetical protein ACOCZ6_02525 [Nanoarchaeota archaeon]
MLFRGKGSLGQRLQIALSFLMRVSLVIAIILSVFEERWMVLFVSSLTLVLTFIPAILRKNLQICLPVEMEFLIVLFLYMAIFLGEVHNYYTRLWWWDIVLHAGSGIALGFVGFMMMYVLYYEGKVKASPWLIALFSFSFALAMGSIWEIFEFAVDSFFGTNMQKSGLTDTMFDLIVDSVGAIITSVAGYFYIRYNRKGFLFARLVNKFIVENPHLFKRK